MVQYQVTLLCTNGKYRPVSTLLNGEENADLKAVSTRGIRKICASRGWTSADLKRYGYLKSKIRVYDKEKIEAENKARYERIKEEKYASGEWKRPKGDK